MRETRWIEWTRRARYTHGAHFKAQRGEFFIDSEGSGLDNAVPPSRRRVAPGGWVGH